MRIEGQKLKRKKKKIGKKKGRIQVKVLKKTDLSVREEKVKENRKLRVASAVFVKV